ncbi:hypothetical protein CALCODRAFT_541078, partial [Calocera cornea HHB12733]
MATPGNTPSASLVTPPSASLATFPPAPLVTSPPALLATSPATPLATLAPVPLVTTASAPPVSSPPASVQSSVPAKTMRPRHTTIRPGKADVTQPAWVKQFDDLLLCEAIIHVDPAVRYQHDHPFARRLDEEQVNRLAMLFGSDLRRRSHYAAFLTDPSNIANWEEIRHQKKLTWKPHTSPGLEIIFKDPGQVVQVSGNHRFHGLTKAISLYGNNRATYPLFCPEDEDSPNDWWPIHPDVLTKKEYRSLLYHLASNKPDIRLPQSMKNQIQTAYTIANDVTNFTDPIERARMAEEEFGGDQMAIRVFNHPDWRRILMLLFDIPGWDKLGWHTIKRMEGSHYAEVLHYGWDTAVDLAIAEHATKPDRLFIGLLLAQLRGLFGYPHALPDLPAPKRKAKSKVPAVAEDVEPDDVEPTSSAMPAEDGDEEIEPEDPPDSLFEGIDATSFQEQTHEQIIAWGVEELRINP